MNLICIECKAILKNSHMLLYYDLCWAIGILSSSSTWNKLCLQELLWEPYIGQKKKGGKK